MPVLTGDGKVGVVHCETDDYDEVKLVMEDNTTTGWVDSAYLTPSETDLANNPWIADCWATTSNGAEEEDGDEDGEDEPSSLARQTSASISKPSTRSLGRRAVYTLAASL